MNKIKVGIIGGAGYTAGELIRILINHPNVELAFVHSTSNAGNKLYSVHEGLFGETEQEFAAEYDLNAVDVVFMCSGHGKSTEFWAQNPRPEKLKVVDFAQDYRDESCGYVYGLPECNRDRIKGCTLLANPGCFATAIQLGLMPLAANGLLTSEVSVTGITGSTGAGVKPGATSHFSWRNNNISVYKAFEHQHLIEIKYNLGMVQGSAVADINFVPVRGDFARGIFVVSHLDCALSIEEVTKLYKDYYANAAFTFVMDSNPDLKQVVNTNKAIVHVEKHGGKLMVLSMIDNLLKGASGQAVQNMNLMFGLPENAGLNLKSSAF
ncbi:MAG: N-acetyl-gamma-glutamyl-phosphate reductase [Paludibacteraceae bacterium]|nr:N-acetyl-gamma-glutamyl-phosphate reductase [Paludibacteraceae bacterium]